MRGKAVNDVGQQYSLASAFPGVAVWKRDERYGVADSS